jgi:transcriptional regulator with XRE-family HTH domain
MVNFHYLMETFAEWLLEEMGRKNMSQQTLAQKSGITPAQISRVITGQRGLGEKSLTAIAHALNISPITIFRKAGLLPEGGEQVSFEDWQHLITQLTNDEQEEMRAIIEMKIDRRQKAEQSARAKNFKPKKAG